MKKDEFDAKLDANIPGAASRVCYCMLNKIYTRANASDIYELAIASKDFSCVQLYRTCNLEDILGFGYSCDFALEDRYLRCNPFVQTATGDSIASSSLETVIGYAREKTIFSFIKEASRNNYVIIDDSVLKSDSVNGFGTTLMHNVRFSKTTMSIYVPMVVKDGLFNKMLVMEEAGKLAMRPFYYGVLENTRTDFGKFITKKVLNNICYDIYQVEFLPVFDSIGKLVSGVVINTAVQYSECCGFAISALTELMNSLYMIDDTSPEWIGGTRNYTSSYTIEFSSTLPKISKKERALIMSRLLNGQETGYEKDPRDRYLRTAVKSLKYQEGIPTLNSLNSTIAALKRINIDFGIYLMAVRYYLFHSHESVLNGSNGCLYGGMTEFGTQVREGIV